MKKISPNVASGIALGAALAVTMATVASQLKKTDANPGD